MTVISNVDMVTAYQIAQYVRDSAKTFKVSCLEVQELGEGEFFQGGPNPERNQSRGFGLGFIGPFPSVLYTPWGESQILGTCVRTSACCGLGVNFLSHRLKKKAIQVLRQPLGLRKFKEGQKHGYDQSLEIWGISQYTETSFESFSFKKTTEYMNSETVAKLWDAFFLDHLQPGGESRDTRIAELPENKSLHSVSSVETP